jgi:hypothetical protein
MTSGAFSAWGAILAGGECYTEVKMILKYFFWILPLLLVFDKKNSIEESIFKASIFWI